MVTTITFDLKNYSPAYGSFQTIVVDWGVSQSQNKYYIGTLNRNMMKYGTEREVKRTGETHKTCVKRCVL